MSENGLDVMLFYDGCIWCGMMNESPNRTHIFLLFWIVSTFWFFQLIQLVWWFVCVWTDGHGERNHMFVVSKLFHLFYLVAILFQFNWCMWVYDDDVAVGTMCMSIGVKLVWAFQFSHYSFWFSQFPTHLVCMCNACYVWWCHVDGKWYHPWPWWRWWYAAR